MKVGDQVVFQAEAGQVFEDGATTADAVVQLVNDDGSALVLVMPVDGEPFTARIKSPG